jgi:hypothetical protein
MCKGTPETSFIKSPTEISVKWVALLLRIREIPVRNLNPETDIFTGGFREFPQTPKQIPG